MSVSWQHLETYIQRMSESLPDKLFFLEYLDDTVDTIVDYGCADGTLLKAIHDSPLKDNYKLIGYDISKEMIEIAKSSNKDIFFTNDWQEVLSICSSRNACINFSSVIHELVSEVSWNTFKNFCQEIAERFYMIAIRDMGMENKAIREARSSIDYYQAIKNKGYQNYFDDVLHKYYLGRENNNIGVITEFLLKYPFQENWENEIKEHYLHVTLEDSKALFSSNFEFTSVYQESYCLEYVYQRIKKDFGINVTWGTHYKLLLRR